MSRPVKCRRINAFPSASLFKPAGVPHANLEEAELTLDEFEAVRLADLEGRYQEDAAKRMNVSRQTFGNILSTAHRKIADCLVNGKALRIEGGAVETEERCFTCGGCDTRWCIPGSRPCPDVCPGCGSSKIHRGAGAFGGKSCHGNGPSRQH